MKVKYFVLIMIAVFLISCDSPSDPPVTKSIREYSWKADTLAYNTNFQTLVGRIWGVDGDDMYTCGHNSGNEGSLWHYNGIHWTAIKLFDYIKPRPYTLSSVHGDGKFNIWVVGEDDYTNPNPPPNFLSKSLILNYDGTTWKEHPVKTDAQVNDVFVKSKTEVWACGMKGILYHYTDGNWELDTLKVPSNESLLLHRITEHNGEMYVSGYSTIANNDYENTYRLYKLNESKWELVTQYFDSGNNLKWDFKISSGKDGELYTGGNGLYRLEGNEWVKIKDIRTNRIVVNKKGEMLLRSYHTIYHYNREDWKTLNDFTDLDLVEFWWDEDEAFITSYITEKGRQRTVVYHGK